MKSIYTELVFYGSKKSVLGMIISVSPNLRSAMVHFFLLVKKIPIYMFLKSAKILLKIT